MIQSTLSYPCTDISYLASRTVVIVFWLPRNSLTILWFFLFFGHSRHLQWNSRDMHRDGSGLTLENPALAGDLAAHRHFFWVIPRGTNDGGLYPHSGQGLTKKDLFEDRAQDSPLQNHRRQWDLFHHPHSCGMAAHIPGKEILWDHSWEFKVLSGQQGTTGFRVCYYAHSFPSHGSD